LRFFFNVLDLFLLSKLTTQNMYIHISVSISRNLPRREPIEKRLRRSKCTAQIDYEAHFWDFFCALDLQHKYTYTYVGVSLSRNLPRRTPIDKRLCRRLSPFFGTGAFYESAPQFPACARQDGRHSLSLVHWCIGPQQIFLLPGMFIIAIICKKKPFCICKCFYSPRTRASMHWSSANIPTSRYVYDCNDLPRKKKLYFVFASISRALMHRSWANVSTSRYVYICRYFY